MKFTQFFKGYKSLNNQGKDIVYPVEYKKAIKELMFNKFLDIKAADDCIAIVMENETANIKAVYESTRKVVRWKAYVGPASYNAKDIFGPIIPDDKGDILCEQFAVSMIMLNLLYITWNNSSRAKQCWESMFSYFATKEMLDGYFEDPKENKFVEMETLFQFHAQEIDDFCGDIEKAEDVTSIPDWADITDYIVYRKSLIGENEKVIFEDLPDAKKMQVLRNDVSELMKPYVESLSDADKALIPSDDDVKNYIPGKIFCDIVKMIKYGLEHHDMSMQNILLKGAPGVGKSKMAVALAYIFQMPYRYTQGYKTMDASEYRGTTIASDGKLTTKTDTPLVETARRGGVFVDEDNNYSNEGENTVKNSLLIAPYSMVLADMTTVKRHPFSIFVMTANPEMKGARPINEAYKDRHFIIVDLDSPKDESLIKMMCNESGLNSILAKKMVECFHLINQAINEDNEFADMLTPRSLVNWAKQSVILNDACDACEYNVIGALCASDDFKDKIRKTIIYPRLKRKV